MLINTTLQTAQRPTARYQNILKGPLHENEPSFWPFHSKHYISRTYLRGRSKRRPNNTRPVLVTVLCCLYKIAGDRVVCCMECSAGLDRWSILGGTSAFDRATKTREQDRETSPAGHLLQQNGGTQQYANKTKKDILGTKYGTSQT